jgi:signal transduction histidine kinase
MYNGLLHAHSGLRWIALVLILAAIFNAIASKSKGTYEKKDKLLNLFAMISLHTQLLIGLGMYFLSPKVQFSAGWMGNSSLRFFGMEHFVGMILAIVVITIGRKKAEKSIENADKHKKIFTWYLIGLLIIIAFIPWPFRTALGGAWF